MDCPFLYNINVTPGLSSKDHKLLEFYKFLDYRCSNNQKTVGVQKDNVLFQQFCVWNSQAFWGWDRFQRYDNEYLKNNRVQLIKNLESKTGGPVLKNLRHPEKKSKQFYESFSVYDKKTQEAILSDLLKRLGRVGEKYIDCAHVSLVLDNIVSFLKKTANQRTSKVVSFRRGLISVLSGRSLEPEHLKEVLGLKRIIHSNLFEECQTNREMFNITGDIEDLLPVPYKRERKIPVQLMH